MPQNSYIPYVTTDLEPASSNGGGVNMPQAGSRQVSIYLIGNGVANQFNFKAKTQGLTLTARVGGVPVILSV